MRSISCCTSYFYFIQATEKLFLAETFFQSLANDAKENKTNNLCKIDLELDTLSEF